MANILVIKFKRLEYCTAWGIITERNDSQNMFDFMPEALKLETSKYENLPFLKYPFSNSPSLNC